MALRGEEDAAEEDWEMKMIRTIDSRETIKKAADMMEPGAADVRAALVLLLSDIALSLAAIADAQREEVQKK